MLALHTADWAASPHAENSLRCFFGSFTLHQRVNRPAFSPSRHLAQMPPSKEELITKHSPKVINWGDASIGYSQYDGRMV